MVQFFVSCQLGFEEALASEIKNFWFEMIDLDGQPTRSICPEFEKHQGGVEFFIEEKLTYLGYQINFFSKLANRVLIRIDRFSARYFDQFEKNFSKLKIENFLDVKEVQIKIESHKSRLNNEKSILEACANVLKKKNIQIVDSTLQKIFIRIEKDNVVISLDTSGEHLHRRGYAQHRGEAPLRETLAAYMAKKLLQQAGGTDDLTVIDPFVGSGTLLFEVCSQFQPNFYRDYAWLHFKNIPKLFKSPTWAKNYQWFHNLKMANCMGFDIDVKSIENCKNNLKNFSEAFATENLKINFIQKDSLQLQAHDFAPKPQKLWVIANPPYGIRIKEEKAPQVLQNLAEFADGMVCIHPADWQLNFKKIKLIESEDFNNQGIRLKLSVFG